MGDSSYESMMNLARAQRDAAVAHCANLLCFSCKAHWTPENDKEKCDLAHRESWGHEWVTHRVLALTQSLLDASTARDAAEARIKRLEAALELFRSEYCVYDGTDREPNLGMVAAAVHAALAGEETP